MHPLHIYYKLQLYSAASSCLWTCQSSRIYFVHHIMQEHHHEEGATFVRLLERRQHIPSTLPRGTPHFRMATPDCPYFGVTAHRTHSNYASTLTSLGAGLPHSRTFAHGYYASHLRRRYAYNRGLAQLHQRKLRKTALSTCLGEVPCNSHRHFGNSCMSSLILQWSLPGATAAISQLRRDCKPSKAYAT
jgi:hypothetical protein